MFKDLGSYKLYPYQKEGVAFIMSRKYTLLADEMGVGKSVQALEAALQMGVTKLIIVCPGYLCRQWQTEVDKFYVPYGVQSFIVKSSTQKHLPSHFFDKYVIITSYDMAWRAMPLLASTTYQLAILDEAHFLKSSKAKRTRRILGKGSFLAVTDKAVLMTGTPMTNKPIDLYSMLSSFVPEVLGKRYMDPYYFMQQFCGFMGKGSRNEEQLNGMLKTFMMRRMLKDVAEQLPEIVISKIPFSDVKIPAIYENDLAVIQRREVAIAKLPQTIKYIEGLLKNTQKIVVICYHRNTIETLVEEFKSNGAVAIYGGITEKQRADRLASFCTGSSEILIAQISTIGIGVDGLQKVSNRVVFAESDWSPAILQQAIARLNRIGQRASTVFVDFLISEGTIEEDIDFAILRKTESIDQIVGFSHIPNNITEVKSIPMPYGHSKTEWEKLSTKAQLAIEKHSTDSIYDNGEHKRERSYTTMENSTMARPKAAVEATQQGENMASSNVKKAEELLGKAITAFVSSLVHDLVNGASTQDTTTANIQIAGNVVPPEERTIVAAQLPAPVVTVPPAPTEGTVKEAVTEFLHKLKAGGFTDTDAMSHYKMVLLKGFKNLTAGAMTDEERTKLMGLLSTATVPAPPQPPVSEI